MNKIEPTGAQQAENDKKEVVIVHDRIARRREDRYILNFAQVLEHAGYNVILYTSDIEPNNNFFVDTPFSAKMKIHRTCWWIPKHIFGFLRSTLTSYRALCMALGIIFHPPTQQPSVIITDLDLIALFALKMFSKHKVFYVEQFRPLRFTDQYSMDYIRLSPNLFEAKWIKYADEVIVESPAFVEIFRRSYPTSIEPKVLTPLIDCGLWTEPGISLNRIIPDIPKSSLLFVTLGKFRSTSNFKLVVEAFEEMLESTEDLCFKQKAHLVIAGHCHFPEEKLYYDEFLELLKTKWFASQVTVLRQIPTIHQKTLLMASVVVIHTSRNDICSDFLLEAMSLGKPIIALNRGIAKKVIENRITGVLVEPNLQRFAAAMLKVAQSPHIQNFLGEMAKDSFNHKYSFASFSKRLYNLLDKHAAKFEKIMDSDDSTSCRLTLN